MLRRADDQPSVKALLRADPIVHYTIKFTVNRHELTEIDDRGHERPTLERLRTGHASSPGFLGRFRETGQSMSVQPE